jgi:hypothetical protein
MLARIIYKIIFIAVILVISGCAHHIKLAEEKIQTVYIVENKGNDPVSQFAPLFLTHNHQKQYNRIGKPSAIIADTGKEKIYIDDSNPVFYYMVRNFRTEKDTYTNYIYRVHFPRIPFSLIPYHLTAGRNVGLITVVTVDSKGKPVLITTVHTCGCYLAIVPTSNLSPDAYPDKWKDKKLNVFGERLPSKLNYSNLAKPEVLVHLRPGVHRVMDLKIIENHNIESGNSFNKIITPLEPMDDLMKIPVNGNFTSFYHSDGPMKGFVKGSVKIWESLFLSLVSLDLYIGTDKIYGDPRITGNKFYTSLKPWNREASEMWDFKRFLEFWGWKL